VKWLIRSAKKLFNMSDVSKKSLIDLLDKNVDLVEAAILKRKIISDPELARDWQLLNTSVEAIVEAGIFAEVQSARMEFESERSENVSHVRVIQMESKGRTNLLKVAAAVILLLGLATLYKLTSVSSSDMFEKYYQSFEPTNYRSVLIDRQIDVVYSEKRWPEVVNMVSDEVVKTNRIRLMQGVAYLEMKRYVEAIAVLKTLAEDQSNGGDKSFTDEVKYYLAMSYLASKETRHAIPILEEIKKDPMNPYYSLIKGMTIDLTVLKIKE
jgi:tetratricopeptide (TPR) repeat protein